MSGYAPLVFRQKSSEFPARAGRGKPLPSRVRTRTSSLGVQAKLAVGASNDRFEQQADRVAERVMRAEAVEDLTPGAGAGATAQRACAACEEAETVRGDSGHAGLGVTPGISNRIAAARGGGVPLPNPSRSFFEARFGHDFSEVRVHTDGDAPRLSSALGARAFTVGRDIFFRSGEFDPSASRGRRLIAHELTHVVQQGASAERIQREPDATPNAPAPPGLTEAEKKAATAAAIALESEVLGNAAYKALGNETKNLVKEIIGLAKTKPPGDAKGQRNYYLNKLKLAITTPFEGTASGGGEDYGCTKKNAEDNQKAVDAALATEKLWHGAFSDLDETVVASGTHKVPRVGQGGKKFLVDNTDPRNIRVQMKIKLNGAPAEVTKIKLLEDAIERASYTKGYHLDIVFVNTSGPDVFEFNVKFCEWANSGNLASGPSDLSHEISHALGLDDRYDYIEAHADNRQMSVPMRLHWFREQMKKSAGARDPFSKMSVSSNPLLAEDVCAIAFATPPERKKCVDARKDLDAAGIPAP